MAEMIDGSTMKMSSVRLVLTGLLDPIPYSWERSLTNEAYSGASVFVLPQVLRSLSAALSRHCASWT